MIERRAAQVLAERPGRAPLFHRRHHGIIDVAPRAITKEDVFEIAASGRIHDRKTGIARLRKRHVSEQGPPVTVPAPTLRQLGAVLWQIACDLKKPGDRRSRWMLLGRIAFHQGTLRS